MNKERLTRARLEPATSGLTSPGLYQLSYLALHWRSPYFVNIFVQGCQSEVMKIQIKLSIQVIYPHVTNICMKQLWQ